MLAKLKEKEPEVKEKQKEKKKKEEKPQEMLAKQKEKKKEKTKAQEMLAKQKEKQKEDKAKKEEKEKQSDIEFVKTLKKYMTDYGLSQSQLADTLGVNPAQVSHWLSGKRYKNKAEMLAKLKEAGGEPPAGFIWKAKLKKKEPVANA